MQFVVNRDLTLNTVDILQPGFGFAGTANYVVELYANNPTGGPYDGGCNCNLSGPAAAPFFTSVVTPYPLPASQTQRSITVNYAFTGIVAPTTYWLVVKENNGTRWQNCAGTFPYIDNSGQNALRIIKSLKDNSTTTAYGHAYNWNFTAGSVYSCGRVFICAIDNCVAPVDLIEFNAIKYPQGNLLTWKTASEQNSSFYMVQRSLDGIHFEDIGRLAAAGNSSSLLSYNYLDVGVSELNGVVYYRLKQVDEDATSSYSEIRSIRRSDLIQQGLSIYPMPVKRGQNATIEYISVMKETITIEIMDSPGKVIYTEQYAINEGPNSVQLDCSSLSSGLYYLKIVGNTVKSSKLVVE
jgi:hypothetical protein